MPEEMPEPEVVLAVFDSRKIVPEPSNQATTLKVSEEASSFFLGSLLPREGQEDARGRECVSADEALHRRPVLAAAPAVAKRAKAVIVAKLCRLSRDVHFISGLMAHKVPFVVALNDRDIRTARGGEWHNSTVRNLLLARA